MSSSSVVTSSFTLNPRKHIWDTHRITRIEKKPFSNASRRRLARFSEKFLQIICKFCGHGFSHEYTWRAHPRWFHVVPRPPDKKGTHSQVYTYVYRCVCWEMRCHRSFGLPSIKHYSIVVLRSWMIIFSEQGSVQRTVSEVTQLCVR